MRTIASLSARWTDVDCTRDLLDQAITEAVSHVLGNNDQEAAFRDLVHSQLVLREHMREPLGTHPERFEEIMRELEQRYYSREPQLAETIAQPPWRFDWRRSAAIVLTVGLAGVLLDSAHEVPRGLLVAIGGLLALLLSLGPWRVASRAKSTVVGVADTMQRLGLRWQIRRVRTRLRNARIRYERHAQWVEQRSKLVMATYRLYRRRAELMRSEAPHAALTLSQHLNGNGYGEAEN
jgi:hypothetical protein